MSAVVWWVALGLYCAMVLATWCAGAFGIGASMSDRRENALRKSRSEWFGSTDYATGYMACGISAAVSMTLVAGLIWPAAIPMYLAYRKGVYVDDALAKRNALLSKDGAS